MFREEAEAGGGSYYFERDFHMNVQGHDLTTDLLYQFVDETFITADNSNEESCVGNAILGEIIL